LEVETGFSGNKEEPVYPVLDTIPNAKRVYGIIMNAQRENGQEMTHTKNIQARVSQKAARSQNLLSAR
jgi:hypothetical protein